MLIPRKFIGSQRAFSMVELLTVIGIIAILIALLLPALNRAKAQSQSIVCQSNLRQIFQAALMFAADHGGYIQIAGKTNGATATPAAIGDPQEIHYAYFQDNGAARPAPFPVALAPYLGSKIRLDSADHLTSDYSSSSCIALRVFTCPSQGEAPLATTISGDLDGWIGPALPTSYGYNEGVTGFLEDSNHRLRGQLPKVRPSSTIFFMTDAVPRTEFPPNFIAWFPDESGSATLADALPDANGNFRVGMPSQFDLFRHHGRINVVFFDGHVESLVIDPGDLQNAMVVAE